MKFKTLFYTFFIRQYKLIGNIKHYLGEGNFSPCWFSPNYAKRVNFSYLVPFQHSVATLDITVSNLISFICLCPQILDKL